MADPPAAPGPPDVAPPTAPARPTAHYRGYLFADLRGYTGFVESRGNVAAADLLGAYRLMTRAVVARHDGAEIKTEGDSFYVVFPSASEAVLCAVALVSDAAEASRLRPDRPIRVGVGVHAGETVETPEGFVGAAVNVAARVCSQAAAGEVIVTETVRSMVGTMPDLGFRSLGRRRLKGVHEPVMLYRVAAGAETADGRARSGLLPGVANGRAGKALLLAGILVVVIGVTAVVGLRGGQGEATPSPPLASGSAGLPVESRLAVPSPNAIDSPSPSVVSAAPFVRPLTAQVKISLQGGPRLVVATTDAIWVVVDDLGSDTSTLTRIDPRSNGVTARVPLPTNAVSIAADGRDLWVALQTNQIVRVAGRTNEIDGSAQVNDPYDLAVHDGSVWVTASVRPGNDPHGQQTLLVQVDTRTRAVKKTIDLGRRVSDVVATTDSIWISGEAIWRVDPVDGRVASTFNISSRPLAVGPDSVWVVDPAADIVRLDSDSGREQARMAEPFSVRTLFFDDRWLWAEGTGDPTALVQFDPASNQVVAGTTLGLTGNAGGVRWDGGIVAGFGSTWVCDSGRRELLRMQLEP